jgi:segregation and condensation protein B
MKALQEREWVRIVGHRDVPGRPALYGSTREFLDYFNLKTLDDLPALAELAGLNKVQPQLALEPQTK